MTNIRIFMISLAGFLLSGILLSGGPAVAQNVYAYPNAGQTPEQEQQDRWECHNWSVQQSGFDPSAPRPAYAAPQQQQQQQQQRGNPMGGLIGGAVGGAALGALGGAIAGNPGKGAAIGAGAGALLGLLHEGSKGSEAAPAPAPAQPAYDYQGQSDYNNAYKACMRGRNYTVD